MNDVTFDMDDLASELNALSDTDRNGLPFGLIGLAPDGKVRFFSDTEAKQSGRGDMPTVGLMFFRHVAPCMNTHDVRGRIEKAIESGQLDLELGHTGDFSDPARLLRIRAMSTSDGGMWLAIERPTSS